MNYKSMIKKIQDYKISIKSRSNKENYDELCSLCENLENYCNLFLLDRISEENFITEEMQDFIIKETCNSVEQLRYFIGDTKKDDIYKLVDYDHLVNVNFTDYEKLCDELMKMISINFESNEKKNESEM